MKAESERKREWFVVPPYDRTDWEIVDDKGELIGVIEEKEDAKLIVKLHNIARETNNILRYDDSK